MVKLAKMLLVVYLMNIVYVIMEGVIMSRSYQQVLIAITMIVSIYVMTYGLTSIIEMTVQLSNIMYSAGHNVGTYLKGVFN